MNKLTTITGVIASLLITFNTLSQGNNNGNANTNNNANGTALKWDRQGNSVDTSDFIGTTNERALKMKTNNEQRLIITPDGRVGVGIWNPLEKFDVLGTIRTREDLKVDGNFYVGGQSHFTGNMAVNGYLILNNVLPATDGESDLIVRGEDGVLKKLTLAEMADAAFLPKLCFEGSQPVWSGEYVPAQGDEMGYGKLYTGCADRVGVLTNNPMHPLDVNGHGQFRTSLSVNHRLSVGTEISTFARFIVKNSSGAAAIHVDQSGNTSPYAKLLFLQYTDPSTEIIKVGNSETGHVPLLIDAAGNFRLANANRTIMYMNAAEETFYTRRIIVDQQTWPDYVFEQNYKLLTLYEVQDYINENGHLPGVPSREKVLENGSDLGEMNRVLLEKIEELILYTLQQQEQIDDLKKQIERNTIINYQKN